ncbi:MAG: hypothetical protein GY940_16240, partial [bacterium]|nr:hypothetical protein [bacterium]
MPFVLLLIPMKQRLHTRSTRQLSVSIFIFLLFISYLWGLDPDKRINQYMVDHYQRETFKDIPSNAILCITQTPDGYLWAGTGEGLVRFDGMKFEGIRFAEREDHNLQDVRHLSVDSQGVLWIGTSKGLTRYNSTNNQSETFTEADGITVDGIRRFMHDSRGDTWISFDTSYVNRFSDGKFTAFNDSDGLQGKEINAILEDRRGNLLFGSQGNGIFIYKDGTFSRYSVKDLENHPIVVMYEDQHGNLWVGTRNGLFKVNPVKRTSPAKYTTRHGLTHNFITSIMEDSDGNLWIGTVRGLNRIKQEQPGTIGFENHFDSKFSFPIGKKPKNGKSVGIIGSGPAGLACGA